MDIADNIMCGSIEFNDVGLLDEYWDGSVTQIVYLLQGE